MLRKALCLSICVFALLAGCEKKEPEEAQPQRVVRVEEEQPTAPPGMTPIREGASVFISEDPVTVGEYVEYLRATDQVVPAKWLGVEPGTAGAQAPVTGLGRQEAEFYAIHELKRLPTRTEWNVAAAVMGDRPYPWADGEPASPDAALFLVRDWVPGSQGEQEARERARELPQLILAEHQKELEQLRADVQQLIEEYEARQKEMWQELKPAFFALLDKQKELAQRVAEQQRRLEALELTEELFDNKRKLAGRLAAEELSPEEQDRVVEDYNSVLADTLAKIQEVQAGLEEDIQDMQNRVMELTRRFEEEGRSRLSTLSEQARQLLAQGEQKAESIREAVTRKARLRELKEKLQDARPTLEEMPTLEDVKRKAAEIDQQLTELAEDEEVEKRIQDLQARIRSI
ncbi:MAG: SUMF1/EgtB/PvdO family nonheme iron enzyme, partial [Candidatus Brocadiia bacterium]